MRRGRAMGRPWRRWLVLATIAVAASLGTAARAGEVIHAAPGGDDRADGSEDHPVRGSNAFRDNGRGDVRR